MPIEVVRFGVGHRRPEGPPGTRGIKGQIIHSDARGVISELAFARGAVVEPHSNPNTTWFIVIEGGGWVGVDAERLRVAAGEAVLWPAGVPHGAWTEQGQMRAIVVELAGEDDSLVRGILPGTSRRIGPRDAVRGGAAPAEGALTDRAPRDDAIDRTTGEPL